MRNDKDETTPLNGWNGSKFAASDGGQERLAFSGEFN
jgi:hypothetical protein